MKKTIITLAAALVVLCVGIFVGIRYTLHTQHIESGQVEGIYTVTVAGQTWHYE